MDRRGRQLSSAGPGQVDVAARDLAIVASVPRGLFIAGEWRDSDSGFGVEDPSTAESLCEVAHATAADAVEALDAAARVQDDWAATPPRVRSEILRRAFDRVHRDADRFAAIMSLEAGKTNAEAAGEIDYGADFLRWYAEEAVRSDGDYRMGPSGDKRILVSAHPVGPCLLISPWNFPLAMVTRKVAPALAAGCTAVVSRRRRRH